MTETTGPNTHEGRGHFQVTLAPEEPELDGALYRFGFTKIWSGALEGTGRGIMLSGGDPASGNAGYVAGELFDGSLEARRGSFLLQQFGDLDQGRETLHYQVINGSATGDLIGLTGHLDLEIDEDGAHRYVLRYRLDTD